MSKIVFAVNVTVARNKWPVFTIYIRLLTAVKATYLFCFVATAR